MNLSDVDLTKIYDLAGRLADDYRANIRNHDITAEGNLENFTYTIDFKNNSFQVVFNLPYYWRWIEEGRKPTVKMGPGAVRKAIRKWIDVKGILQHPSYSEGIGPRRCTIPTKDQLAYLITRKIHKYGYFSQKYQYKLGQLQHTLDENDELINEIADEIGAQITRLSIGKDIENFDKG